jgi:error-prone DNA polymerase
MTAAFAELHSLSAFSFLEGASQPEKMIDQAAKLGYEAIAITDRAGFYGSARAHQAAKECGIRALVGTTLDLPDGTRFPVLCATRDGYRLMSRHLTDRYLLSEESHSLSPATGHLIALTGGRDGPVCKPLLRDDRPQALEAARQLVSMFGKENVFVELHRHGLRDDGRLNRYLIDLAEHLRLPVVASNTPLHATRQDRKLADAFTCLRHHVPLDRAGRLLLPNAERHLKSPREMVALFSDLPQAIDNSLRISERISFTLENLGYRFPDFPDGRGNPLSLPEQSTLLRRLAYIGASHRYGQCSRRVKQQLEKELSMIQQLGFPGYFLIVHDLLEFARARGILFQGRGSAANSVVCYCLGITPVDPIESNLLFERFLSENRKNWPDIDIDFPSGDRREEVIQHVYRKYGARNAAMTANVITYRPNSAFREMSKVLGFPPELADRFSSGSHRIFNKEDEAKEVKNQFEDRIAPLIPPSHPRLAALEHLFHAALGMPRHLGQHSGGMIICDHGLDAVVPLQPATMPGRTVVQWDKDDCADLGIVKIDLLGLGMLAAIEHALEIRSQRGEPVDLARIPKDDSKVFDLLCKADTIGTFQVESRAQMATLPVMRPRIFYDLVVEVAIIRPGPIVGDLVHPYLRRRNGHEPIDYIHPDCQTNLERTYGVPLFQEQILRMAMDVAGFTGAEADELRRAMDFKRNDVRMKKVTTKLRTRMTARKISNEVQEKMIASIGSFALYGFPESHAISFAMLAYTSCWLKVHYPVEFYTALINHQPMGFYSVHTLMQDAKHRGIQIRPVSCLSSEVPSTVEDDNTIRLGLHRLKGLSAATAARIIAMREAYAFFSLEDFLSRVKPSEKERRILARAGALNGLPKITHRRQALWQVELPLHDDLLPPGGMNAEEYLLPMAPVERLAADFAVQDASTGPHPMRFWRERSKDRNILRATDLRNLPHGIPITVAGMVICRQRPGTAKGHCFISLEDETGIANLFVKRETFHRLRAVITNEPFLLAHGHLQRSEGDQPTVFIHQIEPLPGMEGSQAARSHDFH